MECILRLASGCSGKQAGSVLGVSTFQECLDYKTLRGELVFS